MQHGHSTGHPGHPHPHHSAPEPLPYDVAAPAAPTPPRPPAKYPPAHAHAAHPPTAAPLQHRDGKHFHPLPVIGLADACYAKHVQQAETAGDRHARASHKVGQHVTAALHPTMSWPHKLERFNRCLSHYCIPPADAPESLRTFYQKLTDLVRRHASHEALTLTRKTHEGYVRRAHAGETRDAIADHAEVFFFDLLGHAGQPAWCNADAWQQITAWRDHWV